MTQIMSNSKKIPGVGKYSKVTKWSDNPKGRLTDMTKKRETYFDQVRKAFKGTPGPATYKKERSKWYRPKITGVYLT